MTEEEKFSFRELENKVSSLTECVSEKEGEISSLKEKVNSLTEQLNWLQRQVFGKKSERTVSTTPHPEFPGFESIQPTEEEKFHEIPAHKRRVTKRNENDSIALDPNIPVKTTILDLPEEEKICKETGVALVKIGEEISDKIAHTPGSFYIKRTIRIKYAHPKNPDSGIHTPELPASILDKCQADNSLLAQIITEKFALHLPLYRISEAMEQNGVFISRKLLSKWMIRVGKALKPLYERMVSKVLDSGNIFIDETPVKLQDKEKCKEAYMWVVCGGKERDPPYRIYDFRLDRRHKHVVDILRGYKGVLHSDKYGAYQTLAEQKKIDWACCWVHIRRKFFDVESGDKEFRDWILRKIRYLFMLEKVAWARSPEERLRIRKEKEAPIIDELIKKIKDKIANGKILPKSKFREALYYFYGLIPYLKTYTHYPFARLDNNVAERAIRPLTIGRKNWLFFGSEDGGIAGALLLSFVQTCRNLEINPREYLEDVFQRMMSHTFRDLDELLPDKWLRAKAKNEQK